MDLAVAASNAAHVLIADPDPDARELHAVSLEPLTRDIEAVADGASALAAAIARPPALVITELRLPRIDGATLCSMLRAEAKTRGAEILVVTAFAGAQTEQVLALGADAVLLKPAPPGSVLAEARRLLAHRREVRQPVSQPQPVADVQRQRVRALHDRVDVNRRVMSRITTRMVTTNPPAAPPELACPTCFGPLVYMRSHIGGVSDRHTEQWDYFVCGTCGTFQYRHRTRKLRRV